MTVLRDAPLFVPSPMERLCIRPVYINWYLRGVQRPRLDCFEWCKVPDNLLPLDALRALPEAKEESGIYFLWRGPQLILVGQSQNILQRTQGHLLIKRGLRQGRRYPFTRHTAMPFPEVGLDGIEYAYIAAYKPPYNDQTERGTSAC